MLQASAKQHVFRFIRSMHVLGGLKPLPNHLAIYFHAVERDDVGQFENVLRHLSTLGYQSVAAQELLSAPAERKCVFLSFDDNYRSWLHLLGPMRRTGMLATFYVNSGVFRDQAAPHLIDDYFDRIEHHGERLTLSREELLEIAQQGHVIGSHTRTHPVIAQTSPDDWRDEILGCRDDLRTLCNQPITDFAYPYGMPRHFCAPARQFCFDNGIQTIVSGVPGLQQCPRDPKREIARTQWRFDKSLEDNLIDLRIDATFFVTLTGRSPIG